MADEVEGRCERCGEAMAGASSFSVKPASIRIAVSIGPEWQRARDLCSNCARAFTVAVDNFLRNNKGAR